MQTRVNLNNNNNNNINAIFDLSMKYSWQTTMGTLIWFQAHWVCLFLSVYIHQYICVFLSHCFIACPSQLCLVHWTITLTLPGIGCLIPVCSTELQTRWHSVCIIMNIAPFSNFKDNGLFSAHWIDLWNCKTAVKGKH